ncbi:large conductance mechanosensitive channel protein [Campylobacter blaseri]|uniref:Large-conductance mechanosensitive channel n=1 Tax=Campylobacter blaseri TaxID=2042961 RepID=A0A2P8QZY9_9BACT|nr:large-conductance mechanosensitive channel protein MscL [Campylobacter blaseri]PSM51817.1 large conductance mechanosensitive channel protein MscL [Campylobacter blaseri]PSM53608.1 large conductance mechanosensitive channel protein MscL [Campylobacter blaseri]QKF86419.1 large conductance mechanosensitive channel protein [Campylobacter blaseri]
MSFIKEFKEFAMRGNVIDLAVGVVIGGAFGKIISSLVADIIMPVIGVITGGINFTNLKFILKDAVGETPAITLNYGNFIQISVNFLIIAFCIFMVIKAINSLKRKEEKKEEAPSKAPEDILLLQEIRDLLKNK